MSTSEASEIVKEVGGPGNIVSLTHCATRLRFQLRDASGVDQAKVEAIPGVLGAVPQGGDRFQVVIGGGVQNVYNEIQALPEMASAGAPDSAAATKAAERAKGPRGKVAWLDSLFEFLSDSFRPILGALLGASLFITFMALMGTLGVIPNWADPRTELSPSWQFVNLAWKSVFVFLPLMVAYNASKKLDVDPWIGFAVMAVVMLPGFTQMGEQAETLTLWGSEIHVVRVLGMPLTIFDYSSQVFPPLLMAAVLGPLYKLLRTLIPENVQLIFVPFLSMLVMIPLTAFVIGPIGVYAGAGLANLLSAINNFSPFIFAIVIPLLYPFMVPLGLHWPINAIMLLNIQNLGYDYIQGPMGAWNFACFGATAGVLVIAARAKDTQMRQTATGALAAGLLGGISEPSLYGIHLRYKRIYPRMLVGCFTGGVIIGVGSLVLGLPHGITTHAFVFTSLLTIPAFNNIPLYAIAVAAAFFTSMVLVIISDYRTPEQKAAFEASRAAAAAQQEEGAVGSTVAASAASAASAGSAGSAAVPTTGSIPTQEGTGAAPAATSAPTGTTTRAALVPGAVTVLASPLEGRALPLTRVPDPVFSQGTLGPGAAIEPSSDTVHAPGDATVIVAQKTGHAFGLKLDDGIEVLIHVGIDTVNLDGKGFDVKVTAGQHVSAGDPLVTFDRGIIEEAGYSLITPVIVTNHRKFASVRQVGSGPVHVGDPLLEVSAQG